MQCRICEKSSRIEVPAIDVQNTPQIIIGRRNTAIIVTGIGLSKHELRTFDIFCAPQMQPGHQLRRTQQVGRVAQLAEDRHGRPVARHRLVEAPPDRHDLRQLIVARPGVASASAAVVPFDRLPVVGLGLLQMVLRQIEPPETLGDQPAQIEIVRGSGQLLRPDQTLDGRIQLPTVLIHPGLVIIGLGPRFGRPATGIITDGDPDQRILLDVDAAPVPGLRTQQGPPGAQRRGTQPLGPDLVQNGERAVGIVDDERLRGPQALAGRISSRTGGQNETQGPKRPQFQTNSFHNFFNILSHAFRNE